MHVTRKSKAEIAKMRSAGRIVAEVLALVEESLKPGVSTAELDRLAERHIRAAGGMPSFLNYLGGRRYDARDPHAYPASTCISIDDEIVHGIPGDREIRPGQIVSVDVGVIYDGWHGDGARTFICGGPRRRPRRRAARRGDAAVADGRDRGRRARATGSATSRARSRTSPRAGGYGIVRQYVGHGIGTSMHEDPQVPNFRSRSTRAWSSNPASAWRSSRCSRWARRRPRRWPTAGRSSPTDGSLAAHFEHTIAVTADGPEILTTVERG